MEYGRLTQSKHKFLTNHIKYQFNNDLNLFHRTATAQLVARLPVNGVSGLVLGGPQRNQLFAVAGPTIINVNTLQTEQRMSRRSRLYKIVDVGGTGRIYKRANV